MRPSLSVCVFCGSSPGQDQVFRQEAARLGRMLADMGVGLVYGGGDLGLMGILARSCLDAGGYVTGIIPEHLQESEKTYLEVSELILVSSMHERKKAMFERADLFCILPGGLGTLDETFEILTWKQIRLHDKPVFFLDVNGFWQPVLAAISQAITLGFSAPSVAKLYQVLPGPDALPAALAALAAPAFASRPGEF